ncbi:MAG: DUF4345 domain-containing protein [Chitinophagaceae bacterium]|nr:MAG: DUF4345 domain-containing protein [Chitinophagaceae bacterium]
MKHLPFVSLILTAIIYAAFGIAFLISPQIIELSGITISDSIGAIEIRGFYGGLEVGIALFFGLSAFNNHWHIPALLLQSLSFGGMAAGRLIGIILCGCWSPLIIVLMAAETTGMLVGIIAFRQTKKYNYVNL